MRGLSIILLVGVWVQWAGAAGLPDALIQGSLIQKTGCEGDDHRPPQLWVSKGQTLLYQIEVPAPGTFEVHLVPGTYDVQATTAKGCLAQTSVTIAEAKPGRVELKLAPAGKNFSSLSHRIGSLLLPEAHAFGFGCGTLCMSSLGNYCPTCNQMQYPGMTPWGMQTPWWWNTGPMMYSNFYNPAPWNPMGMYPGVTQGNYPGAGMVYMAKPNLYLEGAQGTEVSVRLKLLDQDANWLASVPAHGDQGWSGRLAPRNHIVNTSGDYRYLYSDYRLSGQGLQDQAGFCAGREEVIQKLALSLKQAQFSPREIADFLEYWPVKLPKSKRYCVYPQDERQLDRLAKLEITPLVAALRRVVFVVQVEEGLSAQAKGMFTREPKQAWSPAPMRQPAASKNQIVAREWGVAFLSAH